MRVPPNIAFHGTPDPQPPGGTGFGVRSAVLISNIPRGTKVGSTSQGESIDSWVIRSLSLKGAFIAGFVPLPSCYDPTIF
jgi:hypothetical protein